MPSVIIHEKVGDFIASKLYIKTYDFYLGILAPDAPNLEAFASKEERWIAHQRKKDLKEWRESITSFYQKEKENYSEEFLLGYYIHVLTDIIFDDYFYWDTRKVIEKEYPKEEAHKRLRDDMELYSFEESKRIKQILKDNNTSYDILNITKDKMIKWKEKEISSWKEKSESKYITEEMILKLENQVYKELIERIGV